MLTPKWNAGLIGPHLEMAAYNGTDYLRVKAGPGTGKTYALMRRVTRLLEEGVDPKTILAVSFTRTAAQDLITKLQELDAPGAELVNACTLHSLAFRILNKKAVFEALNRNSRPMMDFEVECLIADLAYSFDGIDKTRDLLESFESYWATLQSEDPNPSDDPTEQRFEIALERWLRYHQSMLIGEVVVLALRYLKTNPAAAEALGYAHVLVDEYQDLNRADQELIEILANDGALTVIGDEDQSIYSFRHAHPEAITGFDDVHPETHDVELLECRRCPKKVLKMANALILHNERGNDAILLPFATNPEGDVHIVQHESDSHEVGLTAAYIKWYLAENPEVNPGEVLILSPRKQSGYALRNMLNRTGVPAQSFFAEDCLNTEIAKQGFSILSLLVDPNDRTALRAWFGIDRPDKRVAPYRSLVAEAKAAGISPKEFLDLVIAGKAKAPRYCTELIERYELLLSHLDRCSKLTPNQIVDHCWPDRNEECESVRAIALDALVDGDEVSTFREKVVLSISQPKLPSDKDGIVRIMSLHKSKGLTAKCVIIIGCTAGVIPFVKPKEGMTAAQRLRIIEEQRRLFYVALTRTTKTLVISSAAAMLKADARRTGNTSSAVRAGGAGGTTSLNPSPFISELGNHGVTTVSGRRWKASLGF